MFSKDCSMHTVNLRQPRNEYILQVNKNNTAVLFINILSYQDEKAKSRPGAAKDAEYLRNIFNGYKFEYLINLRRKKIKDEIQKFVTASKYEKFNNLIFILGTHGCPGETVKSFDGKRIPQSELLDIFKNTVDLENKIITCIFQTCRGDSYGMNTLLEPKIEVIDFPVPMTVVYSTQPGCKSHRSKQNGSYFFKAMYEVFSSKMEIGDLRVFLDTVKRRLPKLLPFGIIQQPELHSNF